MGNVTTVFNSDDLPVASNRIRGTLKIDENTLVMKDDVLSVNGSNIDLTNNKILNNLLDAQSDLSKNKEIIDIRNNNNTIQKKICSNLRNISLYNNLAINNDYYYVFSTLFEELTSLGGGVIYVPNGTYNISSMLSVPDGIYIIGESKKAILQFTNKEKTCIEFVKNGDYYGGISRITILGGYDGIHIGSPNLTSSGIIMNTRDLLITDINIFSCKNVGMIAYNNTFMYFIYNIIIGFTGAEALVVDSTDNTFSMIYIYRCGKGVRITNGNNTFSDMKLITTGSTLNGISGFEYDGAGLVLESCQRNSLSNIETQENAGHGIIIKNCKNIQLNNIVCDANGFTFESNTPIVKTIYGISIENSSSIQGNIMCTNFKSLQTQKGGINIDKYCKNINIAYENDDRFYYTNTINSKYNIIIKSSESESYKDLILGDTYITPVVLPYCQTINISAITLHDNGYSYLTNTLTKYDRIYYDLNTKIKIDTPYTLYFKIKSSIPNFNLLINIIGDDSQNKYITSYIDKLNIDINYQEICINFIYDNSHFNGTLANPTIYFTSNQGVSNLQDSTITIKDIILYEGSYSLITAHKIYQEYGSITKKIPLGLIAKFKNL